jgi:hypothetical protein
MTEVLPWKTGYMVAQSTFATLARVAFQRFLKVSPDDPMAADIRKLCAEIDKRAKK